MFTPAYIDANSDLFRGYDWIDIPALKEFSTRNASDPGTSMRNSASDDLIRVKTETPTHSALSASTISIKPEPQLTALPPKPPGSGTEVIDLVSDSEDEAEEDSDFEVSKELTRSASRSSSIFPLPEDIRKFSCLRCARVYSYEWFEVLNNSDAASGSVIGT